MSQGRPEKLGLAWRANLRKVAFWPRFLVRCRQKLTSGKSAEEQIFSIFFKNIVCIIIF
jgi:hypothetical protein